MGYVRCEMSIRICLFQWFRPRVRVIKEGCGDCTICTPSPENVNCEGYMPITVWLVEVVDG